MMRPENQRMKTYLRDHGIAAQPHYIWTGSLKGLWRLWHPHTLWTEALCAHLTTLGFLGYDRRPLGRYSGNGGRFSVFVYGHNELLEEG